MNRKHTIILYDFSHILISCTSFLKFLSVYLSGVSTINIQILSDQLDQLAA